MGNLPAAFSYKEPKSRLYGIRVKRYVPLYTLEGDNPHRHLIQVPHGRARLTLAQLGCELRAKLGRSAAHRLVADLDATLGE